MSAYVSSVVARPRMTSTSCITGTGFMKCMPMTWPGRFVTAAISVIEMLEVLLARIVPAGQAASSVVKICFLRSQLSVTASITSWQPFAASSEVLPWMRPTMPAALSAGHSCFFATRSRFFAMVASPRSTNSGFTSISSTSRPLVANTCAMPLPIVPPPTTATFFTAADGPLVRCSARVLIRHAPRKERRRCLRPGTASRARSSCRALRARRAASSGCGRRSRRWGGRARRRRRSR